MYDFHTHFIPSDVLTWLKDHQKVVNAKWVKKEENKDEFLVVNENKKTFDNINPATEEVLGTVAEGGKEEVDFAVRAARRALNGKWKKYERSRAFKNSPPNW